MPRIARTVAPGYPHHVTQRGNYQQPVFDDDDDFVASQTSHGFFKDGNFVGTPQNYGSSVTIALSGPAGKVLKAELRESAR